MRRSRRGLLALGVAAVLLAASACTSRQTGTSAGNDRVVVISSWSGAGDEEGLLALIEDFKIKKPGIEFVNAAVGGAAGANARSVLDGYLAANDPPDSYQVNVGATLAGDVKTGRLESLDYLYDQQGWRDKLPKTLIDASTVNGKLYSVPVDIHRANLLWFNPTVLAAAGISAPPKTWTEFLTQTATFKAVGITPIAVGPLWTQKQLLETILLGELGSDAYNGLWNGRTDWRSPQVKAALTVAGRVFANSDVKSPSGEWQAAMSKTVKTTKEGAAYTVMSDWVYAQNLRDGLRYKTDFDAVVSPGTDGIFDFHADSFVLPKGATNRGAAESWLVECGSPDSQEVFAPLMGALPARNDAARSVFSGYLASAMTDWNNVHTTVVGSLAHGVVVGAEMNTKIDAALTSFVKDRDPDAFASSVIKAYQESK